ncbi:hypothetical protein [Maricaulis sp.]|uniref:hypothetical protein n=1 Tax=Maricaulis sp. TaxID=1486257 RepID=UPI0025C0D29D|nr:hypothetical protein [Maricaulis sp.]
MTMQTGCWTPWNIRLPIGGWCPSGVQSITQISLACRRSSLRIFLKPGPLRKPATVMKLTIPVPPGWWPGIDEAASPKTFHAAQRQK